jgi:peroxiredoxin
MPITTGDTLPDGRFQILRADRVDTVDAGSIFGGRRVVLFAVPGAFTPTCSMRHLPGYVQHLEAFSALGVDVACLAVNDAYVMAAWAQQEHVPASLAMLADGNGDYVQALGLVMDGQAFGLGRRAQRFSLYAENGIVHTLKVDAPGELRQSTAEAMLSYLTQTIVPRDRSVCDE